MWYLSSPSWLGFICRRCLLVPHRTHFYDNGIKYRRTEDLRQALSKICFHTHLTPHPPLTLHCWCLSKSFKLKCRHYEREKSFDISYGSAGWQMNWWVQYRQIEVFNVNFLESRLKTWKIQRILKKKFAVKSKYSPSNG